jgi:hypothetical protein
VENIKPLKDLRPADIHKHIQVVLAPQIRMHESFLFGIDIIGMEIGDHRLAVRNPFTYRPLR